MLSCNMNVTASVSTTTETPTYEQSKTCAVSYNYPLANGHWSVPDHSFSFGPIALPSCSITACQEARSGSGVQVCGVPPSATFVNSSTWSLIWQSARSPFDMSTSKLGQDYTLVILKLI